MSLTPVTYKRCKSLNMFDLIWETGQSSPLHHLRYSEISTYLTFSSHSLSSWRQGIEDLSDGNSRKVCLLHFIIYAFKLLVSTDFPLQCFVSFDSSCSCKQKYCLKLLLFFNSPNGILQWNIVMFFSVILFCFFMGERILAVYGGFLCL